MFVFLMVCFVVIMFLAIQYYDYMLYKEISKQELEQDLKRFNIK